MPKKINYLTVRLNHGIKEKAAKLAKKKNHTLSTFTRKCMECCLGVKTFKHQHCGKTCGGGITPYSNLPYLVGNAL